MQSANASDERLEDDIRRVVADQLGVGPEELTPEVSLTDDLAADSLDLVELGLALEATWMVVVPEAALGSLRTYGELRDLVVAGIAAGRARARSRSLPPLFARVRVVPRPGARPSLERAGQLTPYETEILTADALRAGPGARLEMELPAATDDAGLLAARDRFAPLAARGIEVQVRRVLRSA